MLDIWLNVALGVVGLTALLLTVVGNRWGCVIGLFSQPLWFAVGWRSQSYSICVLAFAYGVVWCIGIRKHFFTKDKWATERGK